jgi:uncharacterized protein YjbJ (UPF0337 family)
VKERALNDRLVELMGLMKMRVGRLIGNSGLEQSGEAEAVLAKVRRQTKPEVRLAAGRFRAAVGQMTDQERLTAQTKSDALHGKADRGR